MDRDGDRDPLGLSGKLVNGRYSVTRLIGRGGMGVVYEAIERGLERSCAIKFIQLQGVRDRDALLQRFYREARIQASLRTSGIVEVYSMDTYDDPRMPDSGGTPFLVMELLDGQSLGDRLKLQHAIDWHDAFQLVARVCEPLSMAHAMGVVHRDIKPDNLFLPRAGGVKVLDFGIAHLNVATRLTKTGQMLGTPFFMSPEQASKPKSVDTRADVYSLGVVLYRAVSGHLPFEEAQNLTELIRRMLLETATDVKLLVPSLPDNAATVIRKAMATDRDDRFDSVAALARALAGCVSSEGYALRSAPSEKTLEAIPDRSSAATLPERRGLPVPVPVQQERSIQPIITERAPRSRRTGRPLLAIGIGTAVCVVVMMIAMMLLWPKGRPENTTAAVAPAPPQVEAAQPATVSIGNAAEPATRPAPPIDAKKGISKKRPSAARLKDDAAIVDPFGAR